MGLGSIDNFGAVANRVNWSLAAVAFGLSSPRALSYFLLLLEFIANPRTLLYFV